MHQLWSIPFASCGVSRSRRPRSNLTDVSTFFDSTEYSERISRAANLADDLGISALLVTPGPDLRYLTGYNATGLERLTCLIIPANGDVNLVVPELEVGTATASPIGNLEIGVESWQETEDPYALTAKLVGPLADDSKVAVDDRMWAVKAIELRKALPLAEQIAAGVVLSELRMRKSPAEIQQLKAAGAAIDRVHAEVPQWLAAGRTERDVARDIADAIAQEHETVDFVIVAGGPNGASPHHEASDRVLVQGDVVVIDIGGTTAAGYCSDSTRTYALGEPTASFAADHAVLEHAQSAACRAVAPGVTCEEIDSTARQLLAEAGLGELFIHRTGHGIGLETHEEPYIVSGNTRQLEPGMAFSVEPGFYRAGDAGARIEDIVICGTDGPIMCNSRPHGLLVID